MVSTVRAAHLRRRCLSLAKTCSIGFKSGEIFWQEDQLGAGRADELAYGFALVAAEIVHDDDVARLQGGDEDPLDVSSEVFAVDWAIEDPWSVNPVMAQGGQESRGLPVAVWDLGVESLATLRPSPQRRHVGLGPGLVDEDQTLRRNPALILAPLRPPPRDVRTIAFAGDDAFFLKLSFSAWTKFQTDR